MSRLLFLTAYGPQGGPSRLQTYNYLPYYRQAGFECRASPLFDRRYFQMGLISRPKAFRDIAKNPAYFASRALIRIFHVLSGWHYDAVVFEKELLPYLPYGLERLLQAYQPNLVVMYDDATYNFYANHPHPIVRRLCTGKVEKILCVCKHVVVWNDNLLAYAQQFNPNVSVVYGGVNLNNYSPKTDVKSAPPVVIGWIGTPSSFPYIRTLEGVFQRLAQRYSVELCVVSSEEYKTTSIPLHNKCWRLEEEPDDLRAFDIGIMPLPDDEWTRGKSGGKALFYMATGLPVVASPVGRTAQLVQHGITGFWASTEDEWVQALATVIEHPELRTQMGLAGRQVVEENHSEEKTAAQLIAILEGVTA